MKKMKRRRKINLQCGIICNVKKTNKQTNNNNNNKNTPELVHANKQKKQSAT